MLTHKGLVKDLVDLIVGAPLVAHHVVSDCLHEPVMQIVTRAIVLQVRVRVGRDTLGVVELHVDLVRTEHIEDEQVHHRLLPGVGEGRIEVIVRLLVIVLNPILNKRGMILTHGVRTYATCTCSL